MAKLLAARVAWASRQRAADPRRQRLRAGIPDQSRLLCDARILNIFEGAAEIQAQVIARRLLDGSNSSRTTPAMFACITPWARSRRRSHIPCR